MRTFLALIVGLAIGGAAVWFYSTTGTIPACGPPGRRSRTPPSPPGTPPRTNCARSTCAPRTSRTSWRRTGQVVRRAATEAGHAIADATADARITAAIKTKLLASRDLSALNISVNTTAGVVTLSGSVASLEDISKAILLAMETDGVREVVSTLQVKPKGK